MRGCQFLVIFTALVCTCWTDNRQAMTPRYAKRPQCPSLPPIHRDTKIWRTWRKVMISVRPLTYAASTEHPTGAWTAGKDFNKTNIRIILSGILIQCSLFTLKASFNYHRAEYRHGCMSFTAIHSGVGPFDTSDTLTNVHSGMVLCNGCHVRFLNDHHHLKVLQTPQ